MTQRFFLPFKFPALNDYIGAMNRSRYLGNEMKQQWTNTTVLMVRNGKPIRAPVEIEFIWYEENSKRDPDNIVFAKKFILDGLVEAGILPQDSQKWIFGFKESWLSKPPKSSKVKMHPEIKPGVEVIIKEIV